MNSIVSKSSLILGLFALATTFVVTITHQLTAPEIAKQQELATLANLNAIIPNTLYSNNLTQDCIITTDQFNNPIKVFRARNDTNENIALAIEAIAPDGYSGRIDLLVAIDFNGRVLGTRTIKHTETPGLGDKIEIEKSDWITSFNGKSLKADDDPNWKVKKDGGMFDQFTGATISPRAVVKSVKRTLTWYELNKKDLYNQAINCGDKA
ncbi:electron transport complex subunit RsxG [Algibacillus agarilyticus]|uniref:electron transport complex subunit RsxG n=1 Tax=Algibacillus agarilyticus TaxID=2234133 RepID=UPI000DCF6787|nr:electron transport complex subunit RsxG [Algibacillus agarilyticus]